MAKKYLILVLLVVSTILSSCKEKVVELDSPPTVRMTVHPNFGGTTLYLDSVYTTQEGYDVKFTDIKFYLENIRNGTEVLTDAALFDYRARGNNFFDIGADPQKFSALDANLGVDASVNHNDPSAFPNSSMLNIINANDMHWEWNPGYIFLKIEAKVDTIPDATSLFNHNVVYHIGMDVNMQTLSFPSVNWIPNGIQSFIPMHVDMKAFLETPEVIDLKDEPSSHSAPGEDVLTLKVITNFKNAITLN